MSILKVEKNIFEKNDIIAEKNREFFKKINNFAINIISSPGSGKTSLVERTIEFLKGRTGISVIEGDVQTDLDAQRIAKLGVPVFQIITDGACHLDAGMIRNAAQNLDTAENGLMIIENVGNLVCPSDYYLGEDIKVAVISVTEGDDKPLKYPSIFRNAAVCVINKTDLLPYLQCDVEVLKQNALSINPDLKIFMTSCTTGAGIDEWAEWLESNVSGDEA
jgi:hydrogenase nickel incorporation protein HypB